MRLPLLKACHGLSGHNEQRYPSSGLHVDFTRKKKTTHLLVLFTEEGLRGMMEREATMLLVRCFCLLRRPLIEVLVF